jgi:hypothetical protein
VDEQLADCHLNGAAFAPTRMYQIDLAPQSPPTAPHVDVYNLKPAMSYVALDSTFKPTGPVVNYTQSPNATTPLDLNLDLGAPTTGPTGKPSAVLIRIVNNDPSNTLFGDDYTIISIDEHKDMFCKYQAYTKTEAIIGVRYKAPPPGKTSLYGSFGVGVIVKQQNLPDLPIWIDPEVENNG